MPKYKVAVTLTATVKAENEALAKSDALRHAIDRLTELGLGVKVRKLYPEPLYLMLTDSGYGQDVRFFETEAERDEALRAIVQDVHFGGLDNVYFIDENEGQAGFYAYTPSLDEYESEVNT